MTTAFSSHVAIVIPGFPSPQRPFLGAFVEAMIEATAPENSPVT
ncbi:hypothetical protein ABT346_04875 [Micromonospora peucetia]